MRNGATATYWKIVRLDIDIQGLKTTMIISPFLNEISATNRLKPIGPSKTYVFDLIEDNLLNGSIDDAYTAILAKANSMVPDIEGEGTHIYDADLAGGSIV